MKKAISFTLNGIVQEATIQGTTRLIDLIRDTMGLTGTKESCGQGECGACTVIVDGRAINSCLYPAMEIEGKSVTTIEGLSKNDNVLSPLQRAFVEEGGIQCGFCSPGMIMSAKALLDVNPEPTDEDIREALIGNLCRCTGYVQILASVKAAAKKAKETP